MKGELKHWDAIGSVQVIRECNKKRSPNLRAFGLGLEDQHGCGIGLKPIHN